MWSSAVDDIALLAKLFMVVFMATVTVLWLAMTLGIAWRVLLIAATG